MCASSIPSSSRTSVPRPEGDAERAWPSLTAWIAALAVLVCTIVALYPSLSNGFTNWDDPTYVTDNLDLKDTRGGGLAKATHRVIQGNYHPLTMLSLALDYRRAARVDPDTGRPTLEARPFHVSSLLIHLGNTLLVFWLTYALAGRRILVGAFCALFFGVHPLHVESVAWIAARKDLLYAFFFLASMIVYLVYRRSRNIGLYALCLALFVLSMLSKPAAVVLPLVLVLMDVYLDGRLRFRAQVDKLPFMAGSVAIGIVTLTGQTATGAVHLASFDPLERLLLAAYAFVMYGVKLVAPIGLSAFYPYPATIGGAHFVTLATAVALLALAVWAYRGCRVLFFGIAFFAVNLVLVLQLLPVGSAILAERYTYLAYLGPFFAAAVGLDQLARDGSAGRRPVRYAALGLALVAALACAWATHRRTGVWKDSLTLWSSVIDVFPDSAAKAYVSRGVHYRRSGRLREALQDYDKAIEIDPSYYKTYLSRGNLHRDLGKRSGDASSFHRSLLDLDRALSLRGPDADLYNSRALTHVLMGKHGQALDDYATALSHAPGHRDALENRARLYRSLNEFGKAYEDYSALLAQRPDDPTTLLRRADTALVLGRVTEALDDFSRCIEAAPAFADCYLGRAHVYDKLGRVEQARQDRQTAARTPG